LTIIADRTLHQTAPRQTANTLHTHSRFWRPSYWYFNIVVVDCSTLSRVNAITESCLESINYSAAAVSSAILWHSLRPHVDFVIVIIILLSSCGAGRTACRTRYVCPRDYHDGYTRERATMRDIVLNTWSSSIYLVCPGWRAPAPCHCLARLTSAVCGERRADETNVTKVVYFGRRDDQKRLVLGAHAESRRFRRKSRRFETRNKTVRCAQHARTRDYNNNINKNNDDIIRGKILFYYYNNRPPWMSGEKAKRAIRE